MRNRQKIERRNRSYFQIKFAPVNRIFSLEDICISMSRNFMETLVGDASIITTV
jgi:hypothetical protein